MYTVAPGGALLSSQRNGNGIIRGGMVRAYNVMTLYMYVMLFYILYRRVKVYVSISLRRN